MPGRKGNMSALHNIQFELFSLLTRLSLPATLLIVRSLLKVINPISNGLLKANRFLVEREAA